MPVDLLVRAVLVVAAAAAVLLGAPVPVTTALALAALAAVGQRLAARRAKGSVDTILVAAGGVLVVLVVLGLLLDRAHVGLHPDSWAVALGVIGLAALAADARGRQPGTRVRPRRGEVLRIAPWAVATVAVVLFAVSLAVRSTTAVAAAPVQLSLARVTGPTAQVVVTADAGTGPLELRTETDGSSLSYPLFRLEAGSSRTTDVVIPLKGHTVITISNPGQSEPLRSVVVDR